MNKQHLAIFVCLFCIGLASCSYAQEQQKKTKEFHLPDVPVTLTAPEDRADYLSLHYWDHFDLRIRHLYPVRKLPNRYLWISSASCLIPPKHRRPLIRSFAVLWSAMK